MRTAAPLSWWQTTGVHLRKNPNSLAVLFFLQSTAPNHVGIWRLSVETIVSYTGLSRFRVRKSLARLCRYDLAHFDEENDLVWVPSMAREFYGRKLVARDGRLKKLVMEAHEFGGHPFVHDFFKRYRETYEFGVWEPPKIPLHFQHLTHGRHYLLNVAKKRRLNGRKKQEVTVAAPARLTQASPPKPTGPKLVPSTPPPAPIERPLAPVIELPRPLPPPPAAAEGGQVAFALEPPPETGKRQKGAHRLPKDWTPAPADVARFRQDGWDITAEVEDFRDYWCARAGLKHDWDSTFRCWIRRLIRSGQAKPYVPPPPPKAPAEPPATPEQRAAFTAFLRDLEAQRPKSLDVSEEGFRQAIEAEWR